MRFSTIVAASTFIAAVSAANHTVVVGQGGNFTFNPPNVTAAAGDTVSFIFQPKNHTVTQSTFDKPCEYMSGGADSGFQNVNASATEFPQWSITVNDVTPLWFYCQQTGHCAKGMVFALNPTAEKTFDAFKAKAMAGGGGGSSASPSGSASGSSSASASAAGASTTSNGAGRVGGSAAGILTLIGLVAGLAL